MAHEIAKLLLEQAESFLDRKSAIHTALQLGMPLHEIESYLDWVDTARRKGASIASPPSTTPVDVPTPTGNQPPDDAAREAARAMSAEPAEKEPVKSSKPS